MMSAIKADDRDPLWIMFTANFQKKKKKKKKKTVVFLLFTTYNFT